MRLPAKALLLGLVTLAVSHVIAITTESQAVAQFSWLLIFAVIGLAVITLSDMIVRRVRQKNAS